jgi:hypothetical protein
MNELKDVVPLIVFSVSVPVAIFAWLYQRAWDRQSARAAYYKSLLDCLPAFIVPANAPQAQRDAARDKKNFFIGQVRHLWLVAPPKVVLAANAFLDAAMTNGEAAESALRVLVLQMRKDTSVLAIMFPFVNRSRKLIPADIKLYSGA